MQDLLQGPSAMELQHRPKEAEAPFQSTDVGKQGAVAQSQDLQM